MRIQTSIFMDDKNTGQLRYRLGSCVGTHRPNEISLDAAVPLRRRDGLVCGLDPVIGLGHLLPTSVVGHQRLDDRGSRETAYRKSLHAVHKGTATDHAVNKEVIEFYGLARPFGSRWLHWLAPFQTIPRLLTALHQKLNQLSLTSGNAGITRRLRVGIPP